jgi:hypothetical protein
MQDIFIKTLKTFALLDLFFLPERKPLTNPVPIRVNAFFRAVRWNG